MQKRQGLELLKTFIPLLIYSVLLYTSFKFIDTKPMSVRTVLLALLSGIVLFYVVNVRLINIGSRGGVFALLIIMLIGFSGKMYVLIPHKGVVHVLAGYGTLMIGLLATGIVFYYKHLKLKVLDSIELNVDKDEFVLNENVNFSIEIAPKYKIDIDKLEVSLVLAENAQDETGKVFDSIVYEDKKVICEHKTFTEQDYLRGELLIPANKMSTFYGNYCMIFWYVKLSVYFKDRPYEISHIIDVKPEILLRMED